MERQEVDPISRLQDTYPTQKKKKRREKKKKDVNQTFSFPFSLRGKGEEGKKKKGEEGGVRARIRVLSLSSTTPPRTSHRAVHGTPPPLRYIRDYEKTHLFVSLAEGTLLERLTDIFAPAREEPGTERGVVHEDDFSGRRLDDDHARRE
jgi:hypothetical protein